MFYFLFCVGDGELLKGCLERSGMLRSVDLNSNHDDYGRDLRGKTGSKQMAVILPVLWN